MYEHRERPVRCCDLTTLALTSVTLGYSWRLPVSLATCKIERIYLVKGVERYRVT